MSVLLTTLEQSSKESRLRLGGYIMENNRDTITLDFSKFCSCPGTLRFFDDNFDCANCGKEIDFDNLEEEEEEN